MRAISTNRIFTDETSRKYFCEIKFILNKRPPTPFSGNIYDFEAITPNYLVIGYQNDENSFANPTHNLKGLQNHCKTVQSCAHMFWNYWINFYLPTLTCTKWTNSEINLSKNHVVIIKSKDVSRSHWSLGRILDIYQRSVGVVRSVKIKAPKGELIHSSCYVSVLKNCCD